jgi:hypothetical protein
MDDEALRLRLSSVHSTAAMRVVDVSECGLRDASAADLVAFIQRCPFVEELHVAGNPLSDVGASHLVRLARTHPRLAHVNIRRTLITEPYRLALQAALRQSEKFHRPANVLLPGEAARLLSPVEPARAAAAAMALRASTLSTPSAAAARPPLPFAATPEPTLHARREEFMPMSSELPPVRQKVPLVPFRAATPGVQGGAAARAIAATMHLRRQEPWADAGGTELAPVRNARPHLTL